MKRGTVVKLKRGDFGGLWRIAGFLSDGRARLVLVVSTRATDFELWRDLEQCEIVT